MLLFLVDYITLLKEVKQKSEKAGSKLNIKNLRSWNPIPSCRGK